VAADRARDAFVCERARLLVGEVHRRVIAERFRAFRTVTVTVRFADFVTTSRSHTSKVAFVTEEELQNEGRQLLLPFFDARQNPRRKKIRLIGVRVEKLLRESSRTDAQESLTLGSDPHDGAEEVTTRNQYLAEIADCLDEAHRLQSRVIELTEQVYQTAGMSTVDRTVRGKVTGLLFGQVAYLDELHRLVKEETD
jgi:hypothetical protein